jgi:hypothetical protein
MATANAAQGIARSLQKGMEIENNAMEYVSSFIVRDPASSMHYSPFSTSARTVCVHMHCTSPLQEIVGRFGHRDRRPATDLNCSVISTVKGTFPLAKSIAAVADTITMKKNS